MRIIDKLVRDSIPSEIENQGRTIVTHIASNEEYDIRLKQKLLEEVDEFLESDNLDELVDILEVIRAICTLKNIDRDILEKKRQEEKEKNWWFSGKIILDEASEK